MENKSSEKNSSDSCTEVEWGGQIYYNSCFIQWLLGWRGVFQGTMAKKELGTHSTLDVVMK